MPICIPVYTRYVGSRLLHSVSTILAGAGFRIWLPFLSFCRNYALIECSTKSQIDKVLNENSAEMSLVLEPGIYHSLLFTETLCSGWMCECAPSAHILRLTFSTKAMNFIPLSQVLSLWWREPQRITLTQYAHTQCVCRPIERLTGFAAHSAVSIYDEKSLDCSFYTINFILFVFALNLGCSTVAQTHRER